MFGIKCKEDCDCNYCAWMKEGRCFHTTEKRTDYPELYRRTVSAGYKLLGHTACETHEKTIQESLFEEHGITFDSDSEDELPEPKRTRIEHEIGVLSEEEHRFCKFKRLWDFIETKNGHDRMAYKNREIKDHLLTSHLDYIIGRHGDKNKIYPLIDSRNDIAWRKHLIWITLRQQAKTTTIEEFIAALVISARGEGKDFIYVYAQKEKSSIELVTGAKSIVEWLAKDENVAIHGYPFELYMNNIKSFSVKTAYGINQVNSTAATVRSCRGQRPPVIFVDEAAFIAWSWYPDFLFPLFQVQGRVATLITTPSYQDTTHQQFFQKVLKRNEEGDRTFFLANHTLVCKACEDAGIGKECCHRLYILPEWKSLLNITKTASLLSKKDEESYMRENMGVIGNIFDGFLPPKLTNPVFELPPVDPECIDYSSPIYIAIDPPSHQKSDMGILAAIDGDIGLVIIGVCSVNAVACNTFEIVAIIQQFLDNIRKHPLGFDRNQIVPIVEANNNDVLSKSIVDAFDGYRPIYMPFVSANFKKYISPGIGVYTTRENKQVGVMILNTMFYDKSIRFIKDLVVAENKNAAYHDPETIAQTNKALFEHQLNRLRLTKDGAISGKSEMEEDDVAIASVFLVYWREKIKRIGHRS